MSIYFDYEVGKTGRRLRRAIESDKYEIDVILLRCPKTKGFFGDVNIGALIELSVLSICMINENKQVIGFLALSDHPNISGVDPADWEYWIRNKYQRYYLSRNTLFIHFMCCIETVTDFFLEEALISVFNNDNYLRQIVLFVPLICADQIAEFFSIHAVFKKRNFCKYMPKSMEERIGGYLVTALRQDFCPVLKMRRAVEEDNDDVVEILDKACPRLKELYGMYYISELIGRHPESNRKILVADIQGRAVAVMCLNTDINYRMLQRTYELRPYNDLNVATPLEKEINKRANTLLTMFGDPILKGQSHPFDQTPKSHKHKCEESVPKKRNSKRSCKLGRVNFRKNARLRRSFDPIMVKESISEDFSDKIFNFSSSLEASQGTIFSVHDLLDDDPFDYDIVNIDKNWLADTPSTEVRPAVSTISFPNHLRTASYTKRSKMKIQPKNFQILFEKDSAPYQGVRNAFMIELFALREDINERHSYDMLEAAFELMREHDYCILCVPCSEKNFPLLQHFCFVPTKQRVCSDYALYVAHRSPVLGKLRVREAETIDIPEIAHLLYPLEGKAIMYTVQNTIDNKNENQAYVFTSGRSVVGLAILEPPEVVNFLRGRFNLDSYQIHKYRYEGNGVNAGFGTIKLVIMYPVFEVHYRFFMRELMRLSGNNTLMYVTAYRNKWAIHKANALVSALVPLIPRRSQIDSESVHDLKRIGTMSNAIVAFSAWFIGKKITSVPKVNITTRIVIIGASRTALGFLKSLLFDQPSTYLTFTNVTLISTNGLPYMRQTKPIAESMFLKYYTSSDKYLKSVPYTYYVNVIQGKMVEIDVQDKFITLSSGSRYNYDLLFLFVGKQYQHPNYMEHLLQRESEYRSRKVPKYNRLDVPRFSDTEIQITCDVTPQNVFIINHILEAHKALEYVKTYVWYHTSKIIVYGATIHAYLCINALLAINVPPENIIFIEPFPPEDPKKMRVSEFCNDSVDETVREILNNLQIKVYRSFYFQSWTVDANDRIISADFLSYADYIQLECDALFYYGKRGIDTKTFVAVHKSSLSYDGGIIIDVECRTRDPSVYAAGPHTRYDRRYYADSMAHKYYDSYEVGLKLGSRIRNQLDPLFNEDKYEPDNRKPSIASLIKRKATSSKESFKPHYKNPDVLELERPKVTYCILPGGLKYLEVRSPGLKLPHHYVQSLNYCGFALETFKKGYFKLHLNKDLYVDCVTCLNPASFSLEKFKYLYGHSATVLKNVHLRFSTNKLDDFYEFFRAPWAFFLYHDHTEDLFAMSKELFPKDDIRRRTVKEALCNSVKAKSNQFIRDDFQKSAYVEAITDYVLDWLSQHDTLLPMYLQPWQSNQFAHDLGHKPMFKKKFNKLGDDDDVLL